MTGDVDDPGHDRHYAAQIDALADEFERALKAGNSPKIEDFLDRVGEEVRPIAFREFLNVEFELRRGRQESVSVEEYLRRFPTFEHAVLDAYRRSDVGVATMSRGEAIQSLVPDVETRAYRDSNSGSGRLEVRCPNCHQPTEVAVDTTLTDLTCSACGSHFSLVDQSKATRLAPSLSKLGRFELIERLGVGGFGSVWKARDKDLDRTVAIKIPRAVGMTPDEQEKFFREARAAAQLRHPHIVSVHEVGRDGDSLYIVSDFVRGATLGDWSTGQQLTNREAAELCAKIADALHHAHEQGVVHRDLKPANIMMDLAGEPHLMDFGLARRETGEVSVTVDGQVLGTPAYMSPEQALGEAHMADRRSDIYSLGVVLFQLLTGELPFRGNARMLMKQVIQDEPPSPRKLNANISKDLETITLKCLEKDPARRYQSADEVASELRCFLKNEPIRARPIGSAERTWRWCRRYPLVTSLSAAVVFSLLAGTILSTASYLQADTSRNLERQARVQADADRLRAQAAEEDAQKQKKVAIAALADAQGAVYLKYLHLAQEAFDRGEAASAANFLARCPKELCKWEWNYLNWQLDQSLVTDRGHSKFVTAITFAPDGQRLVSSSLDQSVRVWELDGRSESTLFAKVDSTAHQVAFSPNGRWLSLVTGRGPIEIWDANHQKRLTALLAKELRSYAAAFSPDSRLIATGGGPKDPTIRIWDWKGEKQTAVCAGHSGAVFSVAFSPDGKKIASGSHDKTVRSWDSSGKQLHQFGSFGDVINSVAFSPDGARLAAGCNDGKVAVWSVESANELFRLNCHAQDVNAVAFSPDGQFMATASRDRSICIVDAASGKLLNRLHGHTDSVIDVKFSPEGTRLASCGRDGAVKLWDVSALRHWSFDTGSTKYISCFPIVNARGKYMADQRPVRLWNLSSSKPIKTFFEVTKPHVDYFRYRSVLSRDNRFLAYCTDRYIFVNNIESEGKSVEISMPGDLLSVALSPDGRRVYSAVTRTPPNPSDWGTYAFDTADGSQVWKSPTTGGIYAVAVSPNGKEIWTSNMGGDIVILNAADGTHKRTLHGAARPAYFISFSPDATLAAGASSEGPDIQLWNVRDGQLVTTLRGHSSWVGDLAFHPSEPRLISVGGEGALRIWDTQDGTEMLKIDFKSDTGNRPSAVAFSADGSTLLVGDFAGHIWCRYCQRPTGGFPEGSLGFREASARKIGQLVDPNSLNLMAWHFATSSNDQTRDGKLAVELAIKSCELTKYEDANIVDTLAAAYAETGDFDKAIEWEEKAVQLIDRKKTNIDYRPEFLRAIEGYKEKKPRRETDS